jgi:hypothetical protein
VGSQGQKGSRPLRDADTTPGIGELERLRAENARLRALLDAHGIDFQRSLAEPLATQQSEASRLSTDEKVALLRRLFKGRNDVYLVDFSLGRVDDRLAMKTLSIDSDEDLFLLMAQAHLPMPRLPESSTRRMVDDLNALRS